MAQSQSAEIIKRYLDGDVEIVNLKELNKFDLAEYDNVLLGGSVYFNRIQKEVCTFYKDNLDKLLEKKLVFMYVVDRKK